MLPSKNYWESEAYMNIYATKPQWVIRYIIEWVIFQIIYKYVYDSSYTLRIAENHF